MGALGLDKRRTALLFLRPSLLGTPACLLVPARLLCCPAEPLAGLQELSPASQTARLEELQVYRVGAGPRAPSSALPIGAVEPGVGVVEALAHRPLVRDGETC
jgi:hypothetical protein